MPVTQKELVKTDDVSADTTAGVPQQELDEAFHLWQKVGAQMTQEERDAELAETARSAGTV